MKIKPGNVIYMDNGATTKVSADVIREMTPYFNEKYGNASSSHDPGHNAKTALEKAREIIAKSINAKPKEIIFTSGGTESNNLAIKGVAFGNKDKNHIITTKVEHKCVLNSCKWLEKQGWKITYLNADKEGFIGTNELEKNITDKTILVSVIHGNNEVGTINNLEEIGKICRKHKVYFHTDACQSYTKTEIDVEKFNLDLVTLNAHKIHGPKGVGALYIRSSVKIEPWQHGGEQELNLRSGTENISGIVGFGKATELGMNKTFRDNMRELRDLLINGIFEKIPDAKLNGPKVKRLCNNINFSFKGIEGEALVELLNQEGICASTGSACSEKSLEPSYVLRAMGLSHEEANGSLRLTLSKYNTKEEVNEVLNVLPRLVSKLRKISPLIRGV